jgi:hypothetical protein
MNDPSADFNRKVFNIFDAGRCSRSTSPSNSCEEGAGAIYRGQEVFNFNEFDISAFRVHDLRRTETSVPARAALPQHAQRRRPLGDSHDGHRHRR